MERLPKNLTSGEIKKLRNAVRNDGRARDIAILELMLAYGPRASEVGMLKLSDIDLEEDTIILPRLKGGITNVWPLFKSVKNDIETWLGERDSATSWLFPGQSFKGISRQRIWELLQNYGEAAGLPKEKCHPHVCRHSAAVCALEAGLDIMDVKDLLGHKALSSTMIYASITNKRRKEAARKLERFNESN